MALGHHFLRVVQSYFDTAQTERGRVAMDAEVLVSSRRMRSWLAGGGALAILLLVGGGYSQAESAAPTAMGAAVQSSAGTVPAEMSREEQLNRKQRELETAGQERQQLQERLRSEKGSLDSALLQLASAKSLIHQEIEDFLKQPAGQERLDGLLADYRRGSEAEQAARQRVQAAEEELGRQHLKYAQLTREVERLTALLASEARERNAKKVQAIARRLERTLHFNETVSFRCSTSKSMAACLAEHRNDSRMSQWVQERYQRVLSEELRDEIDSLQLDPNWYSYRARADFSEASMNLDGTVSAEVIIEAAIKPKKVMPCAILGVSSELCDARSYSLIVRSNRFNDQVRINDQVHGATPVSLILESGEYDVQVTHEGVTQTRKLSLDDDRVVNFRF